MKIQNTKLLLLILLSILSSASFAQYKLTDPVPLDPTVKTGTLPNGLRYYIRKNPKPEKKVELRLALNAGSVQENDNQRGLAHFMEHMGFNGSKHFPKNELVDFLQKTGVDFGADLNAYTSFDETVYILSLPTDEPGMLEKGFTVLEDWAFNNLLDKDEVEKERGVVLEESRLSKGSWERMSRQYFPKLLNGSKYAERLPIGKDTVLKTFSYATLKDFYTKWYRPNLMAVIVVGDIDPAQAEKDIIAHFGKAKNPANAPARAALTPIKPRTAPEAIVLTDEEATNTTVQIYNYVKPATPVKTWADYRNGIIEGLVSSLIGQRLSELAQKENPPFIFGGTSFQQFIRGYSTLSSFAVIGQGTAQEAINALMAETNRARQFGFLESELNRTKSSLLNGAEKAFNEKDKSESGQIIFQYVNNFLQGTATPGVENRYKFLQQVLPTITLAEVNAVAKKMPGTENAFAMIQAPAKMKDKLPDNAGLLSALVAANKQAVTAYQEKAVATKLLDKEPVPGKILSETVNEKLGTTDITFENGVTVTLKPTTHKNDEIMMDAWRWGGFGKFALADKENAENAAILVNQMGIADMTPTDLRKFMAGKTAFVSPYINDNEEGIEGRSSVKDLETFFQLTYLYLTQPRKDVALFKSFVTKQKAQLEFVKQNPESFFSDTVSKIAYNNNPWAPGIPSPEDYDKISLDKSFAIYNELFSNAYGMHFTFVGKLDGAEVKPLLLKYIASLPAKPKDVSFKDNGVRLTAGPRTINIQRGKESQSFINLMFEGPIEDTREAKMQLNALVEAINIKITEKLREEMSGIYGGGLYGQVVKRPYLHYTVSANIPCGPENVGKLTDSLYALIKHVQEKGLEQKDLDKVKETWKKQYRVGVQNNNYWLSALSNSWINKEDPENILTFEQKVDALTLEDIQAAAKKFLPLDKAVKAVLYPESVKIPDEPKKAF
ncbi:insulinase family protein [Terrimonas sp. NA20]|uniref:Insulinase family protein n=1 Tax=Terrimonas ginsenosidimutans TaxID=2908004 RepID=A0ABS9KZ63_9BACT|nr:insulinase family protein [Terrimonas ginsenosidimutans]MCG2617637.1 insulinase family protein [Terrimonas ginsenosidimutans]